MGDQSRTAESPVRTSVTARESSSTPVNITHSIPSIKQEHDPPSHDVLDRAPSHPPPRPPPTSATFPAPTQVNNLQAPPNFSGHQQPPGNHPAHITPSYFPPPAPPPPSSHYHHHGYPTHPQPPQYPMHAQGQYPPPPHFPDFMQPPPPYHVQTHPDMRNAPPLPRPPDIRQSIEAPSHPSTPLAPERPVEPEEQIDGNAIKPIPKRLNRDQRRDILLMRRLGYPHLAIAQFLNLTMGAVQYTLRTGRASPQNKNAGRKRRSKATDGQDGEMRRVSKTILNTKKSEARRKRNQKDRATVSIPTLTAPSSSVVEEHIDEDEEEVEDESATDSEHPTPGDIDLEQSETSEAPTNTNTQPVT